jgi:nucleoside-diphosphate-sugar epimerase
MARVQVRVPPRLLITGASGFVGRALAFQAAARALPLRIALRRSEAQFPAQLDAARISGLDANTEWGAALEGIDVIAHCAARAHVMRELSSDSLAEFRRVNVEGTLNLARQAVRAGVRRFIFISSIGVNGSETHFKPFTAEDVAAPSSPYALSKYEAESALRLLSKETGLELVVIRPPLIYGPGAKGNFESMIRWIERGIPLPLGAIHNKRSLVALDNIIDLILLCLQHPRASNQTFLVSDGEDLSTTELLLRLGQALNKPIRLIPVPAVLLSAGALLIGRSDIAQKLVGSLQVDDSHTREVLTWSPPISVREGLRRVAALNAAPG